VKQTITITHGDYHNVPSTFIHIGSSEGDLPLYLLSGEKESGFIVKHGIVSPWYYHSIIDRDGQRTIVCDAISLLACHELCDTLRDDALKRIRELAQGMTLLPTSFFDTSDGFIETWRIYFLKEGGILILPKQLSLVINHTVDQSIREAHYLRFIQSKVDPPFALIHQLTQLLYLSVMGFAPFELPIVKTTKSHHIPLALAHRSLDTPTSQFIDDVLEMSQQKQKEVAPSTYAANENLKWFVSHTEHLVWNVGPLPEDLDQVAQSDNSFATYYEQKKKASKRHLFLRKRGPLIATIAITLIVVSLTLYSFLHTIFKAPPTTHYNQQELISYMFEARNALDMQALGDVFVRSSANPFEKEVSTLLVSSKMRQVYDNIEAVVRADVWEKQGRPPIAESAIIYGVDDLHIEQISETTFKVAYNLYVPLLQQESSSSIVQQIHQQALVFLTDKKGYWTVETFTITDSLDPVLITVNTTSEDNRLLNE